MQKLAIVMALATTALASPAFARDGSWYVEAAGGPQLVEQSTLNITGLSPATTSVDTVRYKAGGDFDGTIGYDFGPLRLEGEVGYKRSAVNRLTSSGGTPYATTAGG